MSLYIIADDVEELVASTMGMNEAEAWIRKKAKPNAEILKFLDEGGTEEAWKCADELTDIIPGSPKPVRTVLLKMRAAMKGKVGAFLTNGDTGA